MSQRSDAPQSVGSAAPPQADRLRSNSIGVGHIVFFVVSAAAPLSGVVLALPVIIGAGNGVGAAGAFVVAAAVLLLFAVGYTAMSRHIVNAGGFYTFVAQGLGRVAGLGAATLAIFAYTAIQAGMFGALGAFVDRLVQNYFDISIPWWIFSALGVAAVVMLGMREIKLGGRVLGVILVLETSLILVLDVAVLISGGASGGGFTGLSWEPFAPAAVLSGSVGIALIFAYNTFIGFEATTIYGEEAIDPKRTVPRATYLAVSIMGLFYGASAWLMINAYGVDVVVGRAQEDPESFAANAVEAQLGSAATSLMGVLVVTSIFAAVLAFHNTLARYLYALGRQRLIWPMLGRTSQKHHSPYVACLVQAATALVIVAVFALAGADPYTEMFVWASGLGSIAVILLQLCAGIAVFAFFRRNNVDKRVWHTIVAPILAIIGLASITAVALDNFGLLIGSPGPVIDLLMASVIAVAVLAGALRAIWLRRRDPAGYQRIGSVADGVEVENVGF